MYMISDQCILCIQTHKEIIRVFSVRGKELKIAETLADHFWFRVCLLIKNSFIQDAKVFSFCR